MVNKSRKGFDKIIRYLEKEWTEREVKNFIKETQEFLELLTKNPKMLQPSNKKDLYRGPVNKLTILTYRINPSKKQILLVNIRSAKQKPLR